MISEDTAKLEQKRENPIEILTLGWLRLINEAGEIIEKQHHLKPEDLKKFLLVPLVAAYDARWRMGQSNGVVLDENVIRPINEWYKRAEGEKTVEDEEVEMWKLIDRYRFGNDQEKQKVFQIAKKMKNCSQKAIILARIARDTGDEELMQDSIDMVTSNDSGVENRPATLLRWQAEMKGAKKLMAKTREFVIRSEYWTAGLFAQALVKTDFNRILAAG